MKDIKGYEGLYAITRDGKVWSYPRPKGKKGFKTGHWMKPNINSDGYYKYPLCKNGMQKYFLAHRLVAMEYIPTDNLLLEINHKNGIKHDNQIKNLEWCSHTKNIKHSIKMGFKKIWIKGEDVHLSKLKEKDIPNIRYLYKRKKLFGHAIAKIYNVNESTILRIVGNKTWKHVK